MTSGAADPAPRLPRRRPSEVRALLLAAAAQEFSERGINSVTTRDVCARAGVSLSVMYRHFEDKNALLRTALVTPLIDFAADFGAVWEAQRAEPWDDFRLMRNFVAILHRALTGRRDSLLALLLAVQNDRSGVVQEVHDSMARLFDDLTVIGNAEADAKGWFSPENIDLTIRLVVAQIAGFVAFEPLLLAGASADATTDRMLDEIAALALWGLARKST